MAHPRSSSLSSVPVAVPSRALLLPFPSASPFAALAPRADVVLDYPTEFLDQLNALPLPTWLAIGRRLIGDRDGLAVRQGAWPEVEAALATHGFGLATWRVRDALETVAFLVSRPGPQWSRETRCRFAATHGAAEAAALALLARDYLRADTVRILSAPFAP